VAAFLYVDANDDSLPFAWYDDPDPKVNSFYALLAPLVFDTNFDGYADFAQGVFACPARAREPLVGDNPIRISYGMNEYNSVAFPDPKTLRFAQVEAQDNAHKMLMADIAYTWNHPPLPSFATNRVGYKHDKRANMVFFDAHVAPYSAQETNTLTLANPVQSVSQ